MEQDTNKEVWIDDALESIKGMKRATPSGDLYARVMRNATATPAKGTTNLPIKTWAAAAIVLLAVNISSALYATTKKRHTAPTEQTNSYMALDINSASTLYNY